MSSARPQSVVSSSSSSNPSSRLLEQAWWRGAEAWYNDRDFGTALRRWSEALDLVLEDHDDRRDEDDRPHHHHEDDPAAQLDAFLRQMTTRVHHENNTDASTSTASRTGGTSRLAVFLAGCYLDAQDFQKARRYLFDALWDQVTTANETTTTTTTTTITDTTKTTETTNSRSRSSNSILEDAVEELLASYQEDPALKDSYWKLQHQLVAWAMQVEKRQQSSSTSPSNAAAATIFKWTNPYQRPAYPYRPLLSSSAGGGEAAMAVYPRARHPDWCAYLEEHASTIMEEFEALWQRQQGGNNALFAEVGSGEHRGGAGAHDGSVVVDAAGGGGGGGGSWWREVVLAGAGAQPHLAPRTCAILRSHAAVRDQVGQLATAGAGEVIFSVLAPRTTIRPHAASHNLRLTAHLGLRVPRTARAKPKGGSAGDGGDDDGDCCLRVADQTLHWEAGKMLVFDDSYVHSVSNRTDELRAVLLLRFWHPSLPVAERETALQTDVSLKCEDGLRRCNPPLLPQDDRPAVRDRGLERSACADCGRTGYESLRVVVAAETESTRDSSRGSNNTSHYFRCVCGALVSE